MTTLLRVSGQHLRLMLAALVVVQGLTFWHGYQHPFHTDQDPPCFIQQLTQMAAPLVMAILAAVTLWRRVAVVDVAASCRPFAWPRPGFSRAPPAHGC